MAGMVVLVVVVGKWEEGGYKRALPSSKVQSSWMTQKVLSKGSDLIFVLQVESQGLVTDQTRRWGTVSGQGPDDAQSSDCLGGRGAGWLVCPKRSLGMAQPHCLGLQRLLWALSASLSVFSP